jgi:O-acetylserine/cysteine efflux transporter
MKASHLLLAVLITAIWGVNFSVIKLGLQSVDPFILAGIRFMLCALPLVFFISFPLVGIGYVVTYGLLFGVGLWGIVNLGIQAGLSAGIASLVLQFSAFFSTLLGALVFRESISKYQYAGITIALIGLALIISITDGTVTLLGVALLIFGAISWSLANIVIKKSDTKEVFAFMVWSSLFSPIPLFLIAYLQHGPAIYVQTLALTDNVAIFSILFQAYPTTLIGYWVWNSLLKTYPVSAVAPLSLLVPVFGLLGSALIFSEQIGLTKGVAAGLIILGLVVGLYGKKLVAAIHGSAPRS